MQVSAPHMLSSAGLRRPQTQELLHLQQIRGSTPLCIEMAQLGVDANSRCSVGRLGHADKQNYQVR